MMLFDFADLDEDQPRECGPDRSSDFRTGDTVWAQYKSGGWFLAVIDHANEDGTYEIAWADGAHTDSTKPPGQLKHLHRHQHIRPPRCGDAILGLYMDNIWYPATIKIDNGDGTYQIVWGSNQESPCDPQAKMLGELRPLDQPLCNDMGGLTVQAATSPQASTKSPAPEDLATANCHQTGEVLFPEVSNLPVARCAPDIGKERKPDWWWRCWWLWAWKCSWSPLSCKGLPAELHAGPGRGLDGASAGCGLGMVGRLSIAAARGAGARRAAACCAAAIGRPLPYAVRTGAGPVEVCDQPSLEARVVGVLRQGDIVSGFPGGSWLELPSSPEGSGCSRWVLQHGEALGYGPEPRLVPCWAQPVASGAGAGAIHFEWSGVVGAGILYSVEWRRACDDCPGAVDCAICMSRRREGLVTCSEPCTVLSGLPLGSRVQVRVEARLPSATSVMPEVRLPGTWSATLSVPPALTGACAGEVPVEELYGDIPGDGVSVGPSTNCSATECADEGPQCEELGLWESTVINCPIA